MKNENQKLTTIILIVSVLLMIAACWKSCQRKKSEAKETARLKEVARIDSLKAVYSPDDSTYINHSKIQ